MAYICEVPLEDRIFYCFFFLDHLHFFPIESMHLDYSKAVKFSKLHRHVRLLSHLAAYVCPSPILHCAFDLWSDLCFLSLKLCSSPLLLSEPFFFFCDPVERSTIAVAQRHLGARKRLEPDMPDRQTQEEVVEKVWQKVVTSKYSKQESLCVMNDWLSTAEIFSLKSPYARCTPIHIISVMQT